MELERRLIDKVKRQFDICLTKDMSHEDRFDYRKPFYDPNDSNNYVASFSFYKSDYAEMESLGLKIIDPRWIRYPLGRKGWCSDFVLHFCNMPAGEGALNRIKEFPILDEPDDICVGVYLSSHLPHVQPTPNHAGLIVNGKVISKFGCGPIFVHDYTAMPYGAYEYLKDGIKIREHDSFVFRRLSTETQDHVASACRNILR